MPRVSKAPRRGGNHHVPRPHPVLRGRRIVLRAVGEADISQRYLGWLADPEVNQYSQRRFAKRIDRKAAIAYLRSLKRDEVVLAIVDNEVGHVGNIKYGPIDWINRRADISILVGERSVWGKGIGTEAVRLVTRFLFGQLDLNRVEAGSSNPAFLRIVEKLGWTKEGSLRDRIWTPEGFRDHTLVSLLRRDVAARQDSA